MGAYRFRVWSWRGKLGGVAFWALLAVASAAGEVYDEMPPEDVNLEPYQEMDSIDTGPPVTSQQLEALARGDGLLLWKLIRSLKTREYSQPRQHYRPTGSSIHQTPIRNVHQNIEDLAKDRPMKRITEIELDDAEHMFRPQRKWKIKKGKAIGSQIVCYFKLCAFRSPV